MNNYAHHLGPFLRRDRKGKLQFYCPLCQCGHAIPSANEFDGDTQAPSFAEPIVTRTIRPNLTDDQWAKYDRLMIEGGSEAVLNDEELAMHCEMAVSRGELFQMLAFYRRNRLGPMVKWEDVEARRAARFQAVTSAIDKPKTRPGGGS